MLATAFSRLLTLPFFSCLDLRAIFRTLLIGFTLLYDFALSGVLALR